MLTITTASAYPAAVSAVDEDALYVIDLDQLAADVREAFGDELSVGGWEPNPTTRRFRAEELASGSAFVGFMCDRMTDVVMSHLALVSMQTDLRPEAVIDTEIAVDPPPDRLREHALTAFEWLARSLSGTYRFDVHLYKHLSRQNMILLNFPDTG